MARLAIAETFGKSARDARNAEELFEAIERSCEQMDVEYFALVHHVDFAGEADLAIRLHNYPDHWQTWFDENQLGRLDPIHRASHVTSMGFPWSAVPGLIQLTPDDRNVLGRAHEVGIGDGFTVPANVPGEFNGSCSFAVGAGKFFPKELHYVAQLVGGVAFEAARRLSRATHILPPSRPTLTDRQRECVLWAARGKTDWEISRILGVSHETVIQHLKQARERYGVQKRAVLAIRALFDGLISFSDILKR